MSDYLDILAPEPWRERSGFDGMAYETRNARKVWEIEKRRNFTPPAEPTLISWGVSVGADLLCWEASGPDPGRWPVVVWNRDDGTWRQYPYGMVEFIVRVLQADMESCPLSDLSLWGAQSAEFEE